MTVLSLWASLAFAQALPPGPGIPPAAQAPATSRWFLADTPSLRFPDSDVAGPFFAAGTLVVVLVSEPTRVRVQKGDLVGWVPPSALTDQAPPPAPPPALPSVEFPQQ